MAAVGLVHQFFPWVSVDGSTSVCLVTAQGKVLGDMISSAGMSLLRLPELAD